MAARNRAGSSPSNPTWSSRAQKKAAALERETTASPTLEESSAGKPSDKPPAASPTKKEGVAPAAAPKKPDAKAWVDPWA